jgi:hypothetical protein
LVAPKAASTAAQKVGLRVALKVCSTAVKRVASKAE